MWLGQQILLGLSKKEMNVFTEKFMKANRYNKDHGPYFSIAPLSSYGRAPFHVFVHRCWALSSGCSQPIEETGQQPRNTAQAMEEGLAGPQSSELDLKL